MSKMRYDWIDVAKGILICCMIYGHIRVYGIMEGLDDSVMFAMGKTDHLYDAYDMQSFFVITGFCSTFTIGLGKFLAKNIKSLLIPSILFWLFSIYYKQHFNMGPILHTPCVSLLYWLIDGGPWFIIAMFWARLIYWFIDKLAIKWQIIVVGFVYLVGLFLHFCDVHNYQWHQHTFLMVPYLCIGALYRTNIAQCEKWLAPVALFGLVSIVLQNIAWLLIKFPIPVHDFGICVSWKSFPVHIVNSITGTALVFYVARKIASNVFLRVMGMGTLLCYLWNGIVYRSIIRLLMPLYEPRNVLICLTFHVIALLLSYGIFFCLIKLIYENKYLNWTVGKWHFYKVKDL